VLGLLTRVPLADAVALDEVPSLTTQNVQVSPAFMRSAALRVRRRWGVRQRFESVHWRAVRGRARSTGQAAIDRRDGLLF
jgi:hypothetical protein